MLVLIATLLFSILLEYLRRSRYSNKHVRRFYSLLCSSSTCFTRYFFLLSSFFRRNIFTVLFFFLLFSFLLKYFLSFFVFFLRFFVFFDEKSLALFKGLVLWSNLDLLYWFVFGRFFSFCSFFFSLDDVFAYLSCNFFFFIDFRPTLYRFESAFLAFFTSLHLRLLSYAAHCWWVFSVTAFSVFYPIAFELVAFLPFRWSFLSLVYLLFCGSVFDFIPDLLMLLSLLQPFSYYYLVVVCFLLFLLLPPIFFSFRAILSLSSIFYFFVVFFSKCFFYIFFLFYDFIFFTLSFLSFFLNAFVYLFCSFFNLLALPHFGIASSFFFLEVAFFFFHVFFFFLFFFFFFLFLLRSFLKWIVFFLFDCLRLPLSEPRDGHTPRPSYYTLLFLRKDLWYLWDSFFRYTYLHYATACISLCILDYYVTGLTGFILYFFDLFVVPLLQSTINSIMWWLCLFSTICTYFYFFLRFFCKTTFNVFFYIFFKKIKTILYNIIVFFFNTFFKRRLLYASLFVTSTFFFGDFFQYFHVFGFYKPAYFFDFGVFTPWMRLFHFYYDPFIGLRNRMADFDRTRYQLTYLMHERAVAKKRLAMDLSFVEDFLGFVPHCYWYYYKYAVRPVDITRGMDPIFYLSDEFLQQKLAADLLFLEMPGYRNLDLFKFPISGYADDIDQLDESFSAIDCSSFLSNFC